MDLERRVPIELLPDREETTLRPPRRESVVARAVGQKNGGLLGHEAALRVLPAVGK